jgi:hypothetical protein
MLTLFFVSHHPESFTEKFEELFEASDILSSEFAYSNGEREQESLWNNVSQGLDIPLRSTSIFGGFTDGLIDRLLSSNKLVKFEG